MKKKESQLAVNLKVIYGKTAPKSESQHPQHGSLSVAFRNVSSFLTCQALGPAVGDVPEKVRLGGPSVTKLTGVLCLYTALFKSDCVTLFVFILHSNYTVALL